MRRDGRFAVDVSALRPFSAVLQAQIQVTGQQDLTFGVLFPGIPEGVLPRFSGDLNTSLSARTGRRVCPSGWCQPFPGRVLRQWPESGAGRCHRLTSGNQALLSATDCAWTVAPPRYFAFCKHVPTYKVSNLLSYIYLQRFTIVARLWQPTSHRRDDPFKQQNGNHDPPDKSTLGVIRGRKTRGLDLVEIARYRRWKQDGA